MQIYEIFCKLPNKTCIFKKKIVSLHANTNSIYYMKKFYLIVALLSTSLLAMAQDANKAAVDARLDENAKAQAELAKTDLGEKHWKVNGIISFNASATGLWNWAAGGNNSATGVLGANVNLLYQKGIVAWATNLDAEYGMSWQDKQMYAWQKSNDKFNLTTKLGVKIAPKWYATVLGSFKTQFTEGYTYTSDSRTYISNWLAPSYTDISLGFDYKPTDWASVYISPIAGRITTATDSVLHEKYLGSSYVADHPDRNYKIEAGATVKAQVAYEPVKNLKILSALSLFTPYSNNIGNVDVDWDVAMSYQFAKVLNLKIGYTLKYYDAVLYEGKHKIQSKATLGLGLGYSF